MPANIENIRRAISGQPLMQLPLFSEQTKKRNGMNLSAQNNAEILTTFRNIAKHQASIKTIITIDDVRKAATANGIEFTPSNWMGSVFRGDEWMPVGWQQSDHEGSHARPVRMWRLK